MQDLYFYSAPAVSVKKMKVIGADGKPVVFTKMNKRQRKLARRATVTGRYDVEQAKLFMVSTVCSELDNFSKAEGKKINEQKLESTLFNRVVDVKPEENINKLFVDNAVEICHEMGLQTQHRKKSKLQNS